MVSVINKIEYKYLQFTSFKNWLNWDVKSYAKNNLKSDYEFIKLGSVLKEHVEKVKLKDFPDKEFGILGVNNKIGIFDAYLEKGSKINQPYKILKNNWIAYNPYRVNVGSIGIKTQNEKYEYISNAYVVFSCDEQRLDTDFFFRLFKTDTFNNLVKKSTKGSVRQNLSFDLLSNIQIPLPSISAQKEFIKIYNNKISDIKKLEIQVNEISSKIESYLMKELNISVEKTQKIKGLHFVNFKNLNKWTLNETTLEKIQEKSKYKAVPIEKISESILRGKSPKYDDNSNCVILNQKCNRWDEIDLEFAKTVNKEWLNKQTLFTKESDVLINSTGEGTIGRSTYILKSYEGLLFDSHLLLFRGDKKIINGKYFVYWFNSTINQQYLNEIKSAQTTKQTELGSNNLSNMLIPLPPLETQEEIVNQIDSWKNKIKDINEKIESLREGAQKEFEVNLFK